MLSLWLLCLKVDTLKAYHTIFSTFHLNPLWQSVILAFALGRHSSEMVTDLIVDVSISLT